MLNWRTIFAAAVAVAFCCSCSSFTTTQVKLQIDVVDATSVYLPLDIEHNGVFKLRVSPWHDEPQFLVTANTIDDIVEVSTFTQKLFFDYPKTSIGLSNQRISVSQCPELRSPLAGLSPAYQQPLPDRISVEVDGDQFDLSGKPLFVLVERESVSSDDPALLGWIPVLRALKSCGIEIDYFNRRL